MLPTIPSATRRLLAAVAFGVAVAGGVALTPSLVGGLQAAAPAPARYASVTIDTSPLGATLYPPTGERLRAVMQAEMVTRFDIARDALPSELATLPRLVVRLTHIVAPPSSGHDQQRATAAGNGREQPADQMDGETLVLAPDGKVLRRFPVTVAVPPKESGVDGPDFHRLDALAQSYASWSARYAANP